MKSYIDKIIILANKSKRLNLFPFSLSYRNCNNNCSFCYLHCDESPTTLSLDDFKEISNNVITSLKENIEKIEKDVKIVLSLIGGELFHLSDEYYKVYDNLIEELNSLCKVNHLFFSVDLFSNLILKKDRLNSFMLLLNKHKDIEITVSTSYDLVGRFKSIEALDLWYNNFKEISMFTKPVVNIILMTSNLEAYLSDKSTEETKIFTKLLENKTKFAYNSYTLTQNDKIHEIPSIELCIAFFKKIIDNHWNNLPEFEIFNYINKIETNLNTSCRYIDCASLSYSLPKIPSLFNRNSKLDKYGIIETNCRYNISEYINEKVLSEWLDLYKNEDFVCLNNDNRIDEFILNKYGCGKCEFMSFCNQNKDSMRNCYIQYFINYYSNKKCMIKPILEYLKEKMNNEQ